MIDWLENATRKTQKSDLSVSWCNNRTRMGFRLSTGAMASKFKHAERILIGVDKKLKRFYLKGTTDAGYKPQMLTNGAAVLRITAENLEKVLGNDRPSELLGDYNLSYDKDNEAYFFDIGALSR